MTATAFADAEGMFRLLLEGFFTSATVGVETPPDLASKLDFIRVVRVGGPIVGIRTDRATIAIDYFASDRTSAKDGARQVQWAMLRRAPRQTVTLGDGTAGVILTTSCISGPSWQPWDNTTLRRFGATYQAVIQTIT